MSSATLGARGTGLLGAGIALSAWLFAMPSLYVPGVALIVLAVACSRWVRKAAEGARVEQRLARPMVVEGDELHTLVSARLGRWPAPGGELRCPPLARAIAVGARGGIEETVTRRLERRGRYRVAGPVLVVADPLRLSERRIAGSPTEVLVLPRVEPVRQLAAEGAGRSRMRSRRGLAEENELDSLRPYRPGAPASRIHWPTVARTGELVERKLVAESDTTPLVVLDASAPADEESLDRAVRAAASLCRAMAAAGGCRALLPGDSRPTVLDAELRAWPALWRRLALIEAGEAPARPEGLRARSSLFWVTARRAPPRAATLLAATEAFVVTPHAAPARPAFRVAGCEGRSLRAIGERAA